MRTTPLEAGSSSALDGSSRPVVVLAPSLTRAPGGIARYAEGLLSSTLLGESGFRLLHVQTYERGKAYRKALVALTASMRLAALRRRALVAHALIASDASYVRKLWLLYEARLLGMYTVAHFQGSTVIDWLERLSPSWRRRIIHLTERCDAVVTLGPRLAEYFKVQGMRAEPRIIPNAVAATPARQRGSPRHHRILSAGLLGRRKGTFDLVRAFARLSPHFPEASLVLAGDGAIEETQALARQLGVGHRVQCTGWVDAQSVDALMRNAEVFALPSHQEGMAFAVLEAMMRALPVITTPVGEQQSVIRDGHEGLLVRPGDVDSLQRALVRILSDRDLAERLGHGARERALSEFELSINHVAVAEVYSTVIGHVKARATQR